MVSALLGAITPMLAFEPHPWLVGILVMLFVAVSVLLILTILIQRPQGGGLSGAFGSGAGSGQTAFGAKTGDALTIATIGMFALWVVFAVILNFTVGPSMAAPPAGPAAVAPAQDADKTAPAPEQPPVADKAPPVTPPAPPAGDSPDKNDHGAPTLPPQ